MDYLMNSLVVGIGRLSPMILDNLSIQVSLAEASERAAEMFGVEADALTKTQKQLGMANIVMEKLARNTAAMPSIAGSATAGMASLGAMMKDTRDAIGQAFLPVLTEFTGIMTKLANMVLPRVQEGAAKLGERVAEAIEKFNKFLPIVEIIDQVSNSVRAFYDETVKATYSLDELHPVAAAIRGIIIEVRTAFGDLSNIINVVRTWLLQLKVDFMAIGDLLKGQLDPAIRGIPNLFTTLWQDRIFPVIQQAAGYLNYFFRVAHDVLMGVRRLLEGNEEDAKKLFANAWQTAIAVVITLLRNAASAVIDWGKAMIQGYAQGIIEGIATYLSNALTAVAEFISSWMAPGSPPKFLPDIGLWGADAMQQYVDGMGEADFGVLTQFTGEFREELARMVDEGTLAADQFADVFFELRGATAQAIDEFKNLGQIAPETLDVIRERLGKTGEGLAELLELQIQYTAVEEQLKDLAKEEEAATKAARKKYEAGEIGAEEYEDLVKAARERREEETEGLEEQRDELGEQIGVLEGRLAVHEETRDVLAQEEALQAAMVDATEKLAAGMDKVGDEVENVAEVLEEALAVDMPEKPPFFDDLLDMFAKPEFQLDFGDLLPDVEEVKKRIAESFASAGEWLKENVGSKLQEAWQEIIAGPVGEAFEAAKGEVEAKLRKVWEDFLATPLGQAVANVISNIEAFFSPLGEALKPVVKYVGSLITTGDPLNDFLTQLSPNMQSIVKYLVGWQKTGDPLNDWLTQLPPDMQKAIKGFMKFAKDLKQFWEKDLPHYIETAKEIWNETTLAIATYWEETLWPTLQNIYNFIDTNLVPILSGILASVLTYVVPAFIAWATSAAAAGASTVAAAAAAIVALLPVIAPILAIGAAVGLLVAAWQKDWGGIRTTLTEFWENTAKPTFESVKTWLEVNIPAAIQTVVGWWETFKGGVATVIGFFTETVFPAFQAVRDWLATTLTAALQTLGDAWNILLTPVRAVWSFLSTYVLPIFTALAKLWGEVVLTAATILAGIFSNILMPALRDMWEAIRDHVLVVFAAWAGFWENTLKPMLEKVAGIIRIVVGAAILGLWVQFNAVATLLKTVFTPAFEAIGRFWTETLQPAIETLTTWVGENLLTAWNNMTGGLDEARTNILDPLGKALEWIQGVIASVVTWIDNLTSSLRIFRETKLPSWAESHSPPPFAAALHAIAEEMAYLTDIQIPAFQGAMGGLSVAPIAAIQQGGGQSSIINNNQATNNVTIQATVDSSIGLTQFETMLSRTLNARG